MKKIDLTKFQLFDGAMGTRLLELGFPFRPRLRLGVSHRGRVDCRLSHGLYPFWSHPAHGGEWPHGISGHSHQAAQRLRTSSSGGGPGIPGLHREG